MGSRRYDRAAMNRWTKLALLAVLAVAVAEVLVRSPDREPSPPPGREDVAALTAPQAPDLALRTIGGTPLDLRELRGKVVAVNFWATWCPPCRQEMPELAEVWRERREKCFELLGVAGDSGRQDAELLAKEIPYPVLFDADGRAIDAWSVRSFPRTFVLDTQGRVRRVFRGMIDKQELAQAVDPLLPRSCPGRSG
jgi:cytochrome c biogenesis protein CcmG/thiol:disulfide interchange protein DsbE